MSAFRIHQTDRMARRGSLVLSRGRVETPAFMPVGTLGTVKTLTPDELTDSGTQILLGNTYHLLLRPGMEVLEKMGGLHEFMGWSGPILTDSGGFQVFSLGRLTKITDEGATFRSHINGDLVLLTPESCAKIQKVIGSDIAMILDQCVELPSSLLSIREAVKRSLQWTDRFFRVSKFPGQLIFGIVQGGTSPELRDLSLDGTLKFPIDGIGIGGLSVGETHVEMVTTLQFLMPRLPSHLPHYLMGVGTPRDILESVRLGVDLFDCVLPTRNARNGGFFTDHGLLNIRNAEHRTSCLPIVENCSCPCCQKFTRAYLRHLFQSKEILGCRLATLHNLHYYHRLMRDIRLNLEEGTFESYYSKMGPLFQEGYPGRQCTELLSPVSRNIDMRSENWGNGR